MAENVVNIQFVADDSQVTAAFGRLNAEASNLGGAGGMGKAQASLADWRKESGLAERATITHGRAMVELGGHVGKTAADFKAATAEQRAASVATEELTQKTHGLVGAYLAYRAARAVIDVGKYLYKESVEKEASEVRFKNLAGNTPEASAAYKDLEPIAKKTGININELGDAETTLREAGVTGTKELGAATLALGEKANVAGKSVGELADLYLRVATRGEVSGRELAMVAKLTGDETGKTAAKYREMTIEIPRMVTELERAHKVQERTAQDEERTFSRRREDENRSYSYHERMSEIGIHASGADTAAYRDAGGAKPSAKANRIKRFAKAYGISEADAEFDLAGESASPATMAKARAQQAAGRQALGEEGVDVAGGMASGDLSAGDIAQAGQSATNYQREGTQISENRALEDRKRQQDRSYQDKLTELEEQKYQDKTSLAETVKTGLLATTRVTEDQAKREGKTQAAHDRGAANEVKEAAQSAGGVVKGLLDGLAKAGNALTGYDPAKHVLKGSEMPVHTERAKKPGEPGYDYTHYGISMTNNKTGETHELSGEEKLALIARNTQAVVDTLISIFGTGGGG